MKKIILIITALFFCLINYSQSPEKFTYQSIVRAADGSILKTTSLGIRISILKSSKNGTTVYSETHTVSSNINGLVTFIIGDGITSDKFSDIDWSTGEYFLKVQVDPTGGINYAIEQSSQLLSVPYALYAGNSSSSDVDLSQDVIGVLPVPRGGTGSSTSPMIGVVTAADAAAARAVLEIDKTGTDNSTPVSLANVTNNYLTLSNLYDSSTDNNNKKTSVITLEFLANVQSSNPDVDGVFGYCHNGHITSDKIFWSGQKGHSRCNGMLRIKKSSLTLWNLYRFFK